ncbi:MAG: hypothetical protein LBE70_05075 [Nitrososphaerota archaeon]|jgi:uncharacterized Tic20 family protein|nr:hypothetical protein [Nitrososphaerota archaeon]
MDELREKIVDCKDKDKRKWLDEELSAVGKLKKATVSSVIVSFICFMVTLFSSLYLSIFLKVTTGDSNGTLSFTLSFTAFLFLFTGTFALFLLILNIGRDN